MTFIARQSSAASAMIHAAHLLRRRLVPIGLLSLFAGLLASSPSAAAPASSKPKTNPAPAATTPAAKSPSRATIAKDPYIGAIVTDAATGRVLFEDHADAKGYPASMLKLMDLLIILEKVEQRQLLFQDHVIVSAKAAKTGGSQVWLAQKEEFSVDELLYALMVQSANDAAVALAEKVAGRTEVFVEMMNQKAKELGMVNTVFHSVHGLPPGAGQLPDVTTARDFALLCRELLKHPDTLRYTSTRERPFRPDAGTKTVVMRTHNHLMAQIDGCDGFKTGYFSQAGFSIAVTAAKGNQRVIVVMLGSSDRLGRDGKAAQLVGKGFLALQTTAAAPARPAPAVAQPGKPAQGTVRPAR